eukprot:scaffold101_cov373-Prasinococcus_capsulatus_cf.AAC.8
MYDATLVTLAKLLRVPLTHVLYVPSKVSTDGSNNLPTHPQRQEEDQEVQDFLRSRQWVQQNTLDYLLYGIAKNRLQEGVNSTNLQPHIDAVRDILHACANLRCRG